MSELRRDPITGRWIIINTDNPSGPEDFEIESPSLGGGTCPFCPGNERMTPPEILAYRPQGLPANSPGWAVRVVPNKFPALRIEGNIDRRGLGMFDLSNGVGAHEVIIEAPDHQRQMADLTPAEMEQVLRAFHSRAHDLRGDQRLKYSLIFKNYGQAAGASLEHSHSQLIALPIVPKRVNEELKGAEHYFEYRERCVFCDMLQQEMDDNTRIICENASFVAFCPFVSNFPYETWLLPKQHRADFALIQPDELRDLARILPEILARMRAALKNPPYNFIIHSAPIETREREDYHWHIEVMPVLTRVAGFEWGTGFYINPTPPDLAAKGLREASLSTQPSPSTSSADER